MTIYNLTLFKGTEKIGTANFDQASDAWAARIATAVFQSCDDCCDRYELRRARTYVAGMGRSALQKPLQVDELAAKIQEEIVQLEEALLNSREQIAQSGKLLERMRHLRQLVRGHAGRSGQQGPRSGG